ncbi:MAG: isopeptide-forming domain-containing fimbrial protein [Patulibacter sp.]|nr:isopeptide-forming domain-containing fimbrial protein [Patulibacter sp.]
MLGLGFGLGPASASAALSFDKSAPPTVLLGSESSVTLRATNDASGPYGYNLTFRDVLPAGVSYVAGSARFAGAELAPTVIADAPTPGATTLIFENVADISVNSSQSVSYRVAHATSGPAAYGIGGAYVNRAAAYANQQPRIVPAFSSTGAPISSPTGMTSNDDQATTRINAIQIEKSEPNSEGEIMRGIHDHQTVYTLRVTNNGVAPTTGIAVDDYLPAGLEFLGCGTVDNTSSAGTNLGSSEEYAGSGAIDAPGNAPGGLDAGACRTPTTVETVLTDPDGAGSENPLPEAVYTHVRWTGLGTLQPGETVEIQYVAAVPLRENTLDWSTDTATTGGPEPATDGAQTANLDNNSGPETTDEQPLRNHAIASGVYRGDDPDPANRIPVEDATTLTRTAEDLAVVKSVDPGEIRQDGISEWSLLFRTSEYRRVTDGIVTDTLPDGLCPLGAANYEQTTAPAPSTANAECDPVSGETPSLDYASVDENADGSWTIGWNLPELAPSAEYELTFPTRTRRLYQEDFADDAGNPVRAGDSWTNTVDVTGDDQRICADGDLDCTDDPAVRIDGDGPDSRTVVDTSSASQTSGGISIDKTVLDPTATGVPTPVSCSAAQTANPDAYVDDAVVPTYGPGDRICWRLRVDFSSTVDTGEPEIRDFIPAGLAYEPGSAQPTSRNTIAGVTVDDSAAVSDRVLAWELTDVDTANQVFEWTFATTVATSVMPVAAEQTLTGNLMKLAYRNTGGETFSLRDRVEAQIVSLDKRVTGVSPAGGSSISGGNATNVPAGSEVTYRVRLSNAGETDAVRTVVWDNLPAGITCADVVPGSLVADGGVCEPSLLPDRSRITWDAADAITVPADGARDLTYVVTVPQGLPPVAALTNTAGVVEYARDTNTGGSEPFVPASNIDPTRTTTNAPRADDPATIRLRDVGIGKSIVGTSVDEPGNNLATQATVGETVTYRVAIRVPAGTTLFGTPTITDTVDPRMELLSTPAPTISQAGGAPVAPLPTPTVAANQLGVAFTGGYANTATTDAVFTVDFTARVRDATTPVNANRRGETLPNSASFAWRPSATGPVATRTGTAPNLTIVEPDLRVSKSASLAPFTNATSAVSAGDVVRYTVGVRNPVDTDVAASHETVTVDTVPTGITPRRPDGSPVTATGEPVGLSGFPAGTWDEDDRTITWAHGTLVPGADPNLLYEADVDSPAPAGLVLTNSITVTGSSLSGSDPNERTADSPYNTGYTATATKALTVEGGALTKTAVSPRATVGDLIDYTVEYTLPPNVVFYDLTFVDALPNGVDYVGGSATVTCLPACSLPTIPEYHSEARSPVTGQQRIAAVLDDVPASAEPRTIRLTYQGRIADAFALPTPGPVEAGDVLTNSVSVYYNATDEGGLPDEFPDTGSYDESTGPETASTTVHEPQITLDKHVSGIPTTDDSDRRDTEPGDSYTYTLTVTNDGDSPAYDVDVSDTPSAKLTNVVATASGVSPTASATVVDGDGDDGSLAWTIPGPLDPGDSVTLTYTADLVSSSALSANETVVNTATVPSYWNASDAERAADPSDGFREYTADPPTDTVTLDVRLPNVTVQKTTGVTDADAPSGFAESANAEIGESFPWRVVITNPSPSSVAQDVSVVDVLPAGWTFDTGSASFASTPTRPDVFASVPVIVTADTGDTLTWADIGDIAPGGQVVLTFTATPTLDSKPSPNPQRNAVAVTAEDIDGQSASADGPYADDDTADANLRLPTLTVAKAPDGAAANAGTIANYSVVVRNTSTDATARDVEVTDVLQAHQTYTAGAATASPATGFTEVAPVVDEGDEEDPADDTTTIGWRIASIPAGDSVTITVPVRIDAALPSGTTLRNGVSVVSREITEPETDDGSLTTAVSSALGSRILARDLAEMLEYGTGILRQYATDAALVREPLVIAVAVAIAGLLVREALGRRAQLAEHTNRHS